MASRAATTHHHTPSKTIGLLLIRELTSKHGYTDAQWLSELQLQSHVPFLLSGRSVTKSEYLSSRPTTLGRYCSALEWTAVPSNSSHTLSADTQWVMLQPVNTNFSARRWCAHVPSTDATPRSSDTSHTAQAGTPGRIRVAHLGSSWTTAARRQWRCKTNPAAGTHAYASSLLPPTR